MNGFWDDTPCLVIDLDRLENNISEMAAFAKKNSVTLRPHVKTHKIPEIALMQQEAGAQGIAAAKLGEAEVMAAAGIKDIFIANEIVTPSKLDRFMELGQKVSLSLGIDSLKGIEALQRSAQKYNAKAEVLLEVDTGLRRAGVQPGEETLKLAKAVGEFSSIKLRGIFTHAGHAYAAGSREEVAEIGRQEGRLLVETAQLLKEDGIYLEEVSVGSTPTVTYSGRVKGVTELRPGNYVFYDAMQVSLGAASLEKCALKLVTTVISRPALNRAVIDAGSKALALDQGAHGNRLLKGFGVIVGWPGMILERLSEEHGVLTWGTEEKGPEVGDKLQIIPNHACTAVNLFDRVYTVRNGRPEGMWEVKARGKSC